MKKLLFIFIFLVGLFYAQYVLAQEKIDNYDVSISINSDSSISVNERIDYNFGLEEKHGIYRFIPIKYDARGGNYNLRISNINVHDENGQSYNFTVSYPGNNVEIKIGDADKLVTGIKTYMISYRIKRAINFFETHDELYWNVTGNEWNVDIEKARAEVGFPETLEEKNIQVTCFQGTYGSNKLCEKSSFEYEPGQEVNKVIFESDFLYSLEGLTVVVGLPKGLITPPSKWENFKETLKDNGILFLPFLVFVILFYLWYTRGRDPAGRKTIVAEYEPPDNLTPAEVGTIINETAHKKDISAEIINLAVRGYLKITRIEGKGIFKKDDYLLEKLSRFAGSASGGKDGATLKNEFEKKLFKSLFDGSESIKLSSLKNKFYKDLEEVKDQVYESMVVKNYFLKSPKKVRGIWMGVGITILVLGFIFGSYWGGLGTFSIIISGVLIIIFGYFMPKRGYQGVLAKEHIMGLKEYLTVAEKDRIKFHNAPEKNPKLFEKLLPYAMVLGVEKEWAKQFEGIYQGKPSWYNDSGSGTFSSLILINSLNSFQSQANATLASRPASSGGSGFGGGGFSGGGFGGGGGGSW